MNSLAAVAWHEAGHAVVLLGLGLPISHVTIVPEGDELGHTELDTVTPEDTAESVNEREPMTDTERAWVAQAEVLWSDAGAVAERLAGFTPSGCENDERIAGAAIDRVWDLLGVQPCYWRHHVRMEAERFLRAHWRVVERIAAALLAERTVSGERARELAGTVPVPNMRQLQAGLDFWKLRAAARALIREPPPVLFTK